MIEHWSILTCHVNVNVMSENIDEQNAIKFPLCSFAEKISLSCLPQSNFPRTNYHDLINLRQKRVVEFCTIAKGRYALQKAVSLLF